MLPPLPWFPCVKLLFGLIACCWFLSAPPSQEAAPCLPKTALMFFLKANPPRTRGSAYYLGNKQSHAGWQLCVWVPLPEDAGTRQSSAFPPRFCVTLRRIDWSGSRGPSPFFSLITVTRNKCICVHGVLQISQPCRGHPRRPHSPSSCWIHQVNRAQTSPPRSGGGQQSISPWKSNLATARKLPPQHK